MKVLLSISLVALCGCSVPKVPLLVRPQEPALPMDDSSVRFPETVRAYHVGRYAEPDSSDLLHERHTVYRLEASSRWNLRPGYDAAGAAPTALDNPSNPTVEPEVNDLVVAEMNRQKLVSAQMLARSAEINAALTQLQATLRSTKANFEETTRLRALFDQLESRLSRLESEDHRRTNSAAASSNPFNPSLLEDSDLLPP
jgi:hypothetical protein